MGTKITQKEEEEERDEDYLLKLEHDIHPNPYYFDCRLVLPILDEIQTEVD